MKDILDFKTVFEEYKAVCLSSINFGQNAISKNFSGKEHLAKAYRDIEVAFKTEINNETVFLDYLVNVYKKKAQIEEINRKLIELRNIRNTIKLFITKIKEFRMEKCFRYIEDINNKIDGELSASCKENLEIYKLLNNSTPANYGEVKKIAEQNDDNKMIREFDNIMIKSSPKKREVENLLFLRNQVLYYKRQARFKSDILHYQLEKNQESYNHLLNIKYATINQLHMLKIDLDSFGDYELRNICYAISSFDKSFKSSIDLTKPSRGKCISYISSWLRSFGKESKEEK